MCSAALPWLTLLTLLAAPAAAATIEGCRALRERRDALAAEAMRAELVLVRRERERFCPELSLRAEGANANDLRFAPIDYQAWSDCRQRAERHLEATHRVLYRNRLQFTHYTSAGADAARRADGVARRMEREGCDAGQR